MTTPEPQSPPPQPSAPVSKDRVYRSPAGIAGGVLLLALALWLGIDALVAGEGRTPWMALAVLLFLVPLVAAYTVRPAVFAGDDRLRVRNPFRTVVLPWGQVASLQAGYSNEVVAESGDKYQLWSVPVSLRARKRAARKETRRTSGGGAAAADGPVRAESDKIVDELRGLLEARKPADASQGEVSVRWAYEIVAPVVAGAVLLAVLLAMG